MAKHKDGHVYLNTWDLIKRLFIKEKIKEKKSLDGSNGNQPKSIPDVNHIAIILDDEVQEIVRAQNRLAALLLSEPKFVEFNPHEVRPEIGWNYANGEFKAGL